MTAAATARAPAAGARRVDVALFLPTLDGGGAERVMLDLASAFVDDGRVVDLVLASRRGAYLGEVPEGVRVVDLRRSRVATSLLPLAAYLRRVRPRSLLSTLEHANVLALVVRRLAPGVRVVVREANTASRELRGGSAADRILFRAMRWAYPGADALVAVSTGVSRDLTGALGVPPERVHVIHNPVLTARVRRGAEEPLDHPWFAAGQPPVVVGTGRLAPQKRFDTLLRAFARARRRTDCRLVILGEGDERGRLEALARELGVSEEAQLPGFVTNPFPYMARAGAFVLSSAFEGLPNVLIQALSLGTPVVATDCPSGPDEILDGGRLGALVAVGDDAAMADAIVAALAAPRREPPPEWYRRYDQAAVARRYLEVLGVAP